MLAGKLKYELAIVGEGGGITHKGESRVSVWRGVKSHLFKTKT